MIRALARSARVLAQAVRSPGDALLEIGAFIVWLPANVRRSDVPAFFRKMKVAPRPKARKIEHSYDRIARLRDACLSMPRLWRRDTCYIRAFTLYRFLDPGEHRVRVHFGIEQPQSKNERLRGHAWVSIDGRVFEAPEAVHDGRIHEVPIDVAV